MTVGSCELPCVHHSPLGCQSEDSQSSCPQAHPESQFLSLDAGNGQNSSPASPHSAEHWKQLQAQHPSLHLETRMNGLRAASCPSTHSSSKRQKPFLTPCSKPQTRPIKLLHRQVKNQLPWPLPFPVTGRVNIPGKGDKAGAATGGHQSQ